MRKGVIYLAGGMTGLTWRQALHWRKEAERLLSHQWKIINPVRQQMNSHPDDIILASTQKDTKLALAHTATGICAQDEFYIDQSDWIFCNTLNAQIPSIGTIWELGYAWGTRKKILTLLEPESIHDHPFIRRRSHVFTPSFEEAIDFFQTIAV